MRHLKQQPTTAPRFGSVRVDEVLLVRDLARRFGWGARQRADAIKAGLRVAMIGRQQVTTGAWVLQFVEEMSKHQHADARCRHAANDFETI